MPTTAAPRGVNPTRQQLDELDALLQKMLDLPVSPSVEPAPPPPPPPPRPRPVPKAEPRLVSFPVETFTARPEGYTTPVAVEAGPMTPPPAAPSAWAIELNPRAGSSVLGSKSPLASAVPPPTPPAPAPSFSTLTVTPVEPPPPAVTSYSAGPMSPPVAPHIAVPFLKPQSPAPVVEEPSTPALLMPLVGLNSVFDGTMALCGAPGRFLRGPVGKSLLGFAGLAMSVVGIYLAVAADLPTQPW